MLDFSTWKKKGNLGELRALSGELCALSGVLGIARFIVAFSCSLGVLRRFSLKRLIPLRFLRFLFPVVICFLSPEFDGVTGDMISSVLQIVTVESQMLL